MGNEVEYFYLGHFMPEDSEELISIVRSHDRHRYEYWNELFSQWQELKEDSFGERLFRIHDTRLEARWARAVFPDAFS